MIEDELERCYDDDNDHNNDNDNEEEELLEDAIDDGFMCVDLRVLEKKLQAWHRLFSPSFYNNTDYKNDNTDNNNNNNNNYNNNYTVTPYFAVKCNPDPVVVEWLARTASKLNLPLGYDCASIAELELAKTHIEKYSLASSLAREEEEEQESVDRRSKRSSCSIPTTRIVYANPQRAEADLIRALELFATTSQSSSSSSPSSSPSREELWLTLDGIEERT